MASFNGQNNMFRLPIYAFLNCKRVPFNNYIIHFVFFNILLT
nr:MAG TPA: hypothetical protein [Caudoviricetes sp.]